MIDGQTNKLIKDAYSIVGKPDRLLQLLTLLQTETTGEPGRLDTLQEHFDRIAELLDEVDANIGDDFSGFSFDAVGGIINAPQPSLRQLVLGEDLRVISVDEALSAQWKAGPEEFLPAWAWEIDPVASTNLKNALSDRDTDVPVFIRLRMDQEDDSGLLFAATIRDIPHRVAELRVIRLRWDERSGASFATALGLTETEALLTQYIVDGSSVREFAESRGRSVGTARNQVKTLLGKLRLGSQLDLVSLYGGFHASFIAAEFDEKQIETAGTNQVFTASDGAILPYETHGKRDGIPLLFLHATVDGALLTPRQILAARANGFQVIAPWLPFYAGSSVPKMGLPAVDIYVARITELLDHLGIESCPIVTVRVSSPYGFALLKKAPERFDGLVTAGAILPAKSKKDFSHLAMGYRAPMRLARVAPGFVKLYFAAAAGMVRNGTSSRFFKSLYGQSPADLATLDDPEVVETMRQSMQRTFQDGYEGTLQQTLLSASDWSHWCNDLTEPVVMICGAEDGLAPPEKQETFCKDHGFELIGPLDNIGSLAMHQVPRLVFDTALRLYQMR